jgi:dihydroxyacetone kinase-like protein
MRETLSAADIPDLLRHLATDVNASKDYLTTLDSDIGDGDLGRTMVAGFGKLAEVADTLPQDDFGGSLMRCGMAFNQVASSTFGTLLSGAMMAAGKVVRGKAVVDLADWVAMGRAAVESVEQRGKCKLGDKTMLDALVPAVEAMASTQEKGGTLPAALAEATAAAEKAVEETAALKAGTGRAGWFGERTIGHKDPGAAAVAEILKSVANFVAA